MARQMVRHGVSVSRIHADDLELPNNGTVILSSCGDLRARSLRVSPSVRPAEIHDHMPAITPRSSYPLMRCDNATPPARSSRR
ncbi:hypothetical protein V8C44DRAFT_329605 [Trichoderma aethiopicum]